MMSNFKGKGWNEHRDHGLCHDHDHDLGLDRDNVDYFVEISALALRFGWDLSQVTASY